MGVHLYTKHLFKVSEVMQGFEAPLLGPRPVRPAVVYRNQGLVVGVLIQEGEQTLLQGIRQTALLRRLQRRTCGVLQQLVDGQHQLALCLLRLLCQGHQNP